MSLSQQLRKIIFSLLYYTGIPFLLREVVERNKTTIVVFHAPSPDAARGHFEALRKRYNIIPLADYLRARIAEREIERRKTDLERLYGPRIESPLSS
jgi:hypothetical protein